MQPVKGEAVAAVALRFFERVPAALLAPAYRQDVPDVERRALRHDVPEIGVMASALARLLRYNVKNAGAIVTVRDELEMVNVYLRIQQFRFEDKLIFRLDVPEWALGQRIARFTLQPVVENCIVHAVERSLGRTFVHLDAVRTGERSFEIRVRDNGPGIPPDEL